MENEIHTRCGQRTGLVNGRNGSAITVRIAEPDHKFGEVCWSCFKYTQVMLPEKAVQPQKPGTVGLNGGRSMAGRRFPVQEQLYLWNEVQVRINQVPHASAVRSVSCDCLGRIHR